MFRFGLTVLLALLLPAPLLARDLPSAALQAREAGDWESVRDALAPLAGATDAAEDVLFWHGVALFETGDAAAAVPFLQRALEQRDERDTLHFLARSLAQTDDMHALDALLEHHNRDAYVAYLAGRTRFQNGFSMLAERHLNRSVMLDDLNADAWTWLAFVRQFGYDYDGALEAAQRARSLAPVGWEVHALIGECLYQLDHDSEAADAFMKAQELAPARAGELDSRLGLALYQAGRYRESMEAYHRVLSADFNHYTVRARLGMAAFHANDYRMTWYAAKESRALDGNIDVIYYTARTAYAMGRYEDAEALIHEAIAGVQEGYRPATSWIHYLGRALWGQGKTEEAIKELETACTREPGNLLYARWLFRVYEELDDPHSAIDVCRRLGTKGGEHDVALQSLNYVQQKWPKPVTTDRHGEPAPPHLLGVIGVAAEIYEAAGRFREAALYYALTGRTFGRFAAIKAGWAMLHADRPDTAALTFQAFIDNSLSTSHDYGRLGLGFAQLAQAHYAEAVEAFDPITRESMLLDRETGLLWAGVGAADPIAHEYLDPYTALGVCANRYMRGGVEILTMAPDSPLVRARPALRPMDILLSVGSWSLRDDEAVAEMRQEATPDQRMRARIRRGEDVFEIEIDYPAVLAALPEPPAAVEEVDQ